MITVTFYTRRDDPACQKAESLINDIRDEFDIQLVKVDIDSEPTLTNIYQKIVPLVKIGPYTLQGMITVEQLRMTLGAAQDRQEHIEKIGDISYNERYRRARQFSGMDRLTDWLSRHYLALFNGVLFFFLGIPFLAPVLMKEGVEIPARLIYTIYSPFCHQLAFRSWFIFGEQAYYPRNLAGVETVASYESAIVKNPNPDETSFDFINDARSFIGNNEIGFKVALCERDVAMYGSMLLFGIFFTLSGRKARSIHWAVWLFLGLVPIGIDGASQLPSLVAGLPAWLPLRESTPFWRTLTGLLFGGLSAWYMYPIIDETMKDTRAFLASKKELINQSRVS